MIKEKLNIILIIIYFLLAYIVVYIVVYIARFIFFMKRLLNCIVKNDIIFLIKDVLFSFNSILNAVFPNIKYYEP